MVWVMVVMNRTGILQCDYMSYMFSGATSFDQDISNWNIDKVEDTSYMFDGATKFLNKCYKLDEIWPVLRVSNSDYEGKICNTTTPEPFTNYEGFTNFKGFLSTSKNIKEGFTSTTTSEVVETESALKCGEWTKAINCDGKAYYYCSKLTQEEQDSPYDGVDVSDFTSKYSYIDNMKTAYCYTVYILLIIWIILAIYSFYIYWNTYAMPNDNYVIRFFKGIILSAINIPFLLWHDSNMSRK